MRGTLQSFLNSLFSWLRAARNGSARRAGVRSLLVVSGSVGVILFSGFILLWPPRAFPVDRLISVPEGAPLTEVARMLETEGVVRSASTLKIFVMVMGGQRSIHAGDYLFKKPVSVFHVARALVHGDFGLEPMRFRIPEGAMVRQMAAMYDKKLLRFDPAVFVEKAAPLEGYLFPDTYFFLPNASEEKVIAAMKENFEQRTAALRDRVASSSRSFSDVMVMASLLEREASNTADRRRIAGVLWNRIDRGMPLQVDAAFLYSIGKSTFTLTRDDLRRDDPYNTYVRKGFPPTPIGSPSLDSIAAAADPIKSKYLYYLADSSGVTHYSSTYVEHLRKKNLYIGN